MEELGDIVQEFLVESHENLDQLDRDLVELEQAPDSRGLISSIFRTIHTIKGTSGFLAFGRLEGVTHAGESLLARLRDGVQPVTPETITTLLAMVDRVRALLAVVEETGSEGDDDLGVTEVIAMVNRQMEAPGGAAAEESAVDSSGPVADEAPEAVPAQAGSPEPVASEPPPPAKKPRASRRRTPAKAAAAKAEMPAAAPVPDATPPAGGPAARRPLGQLLVESGGAAENDVVWALQRQIEGDDRKLGTMLLEEGKAGPGAVNDALQAQSKRSIADSAIRVDVDLLDSLMNLVGELVLVRNQLVRGAADGSDQVLVRTTQRLNLITSELQEGIMKTRMQPIEHLWSKLPRVIRDLSQACGKRVRLAMHGAETELDRSLLEAVKDPLTHLVRNAVDHGVETPEERAAAGKDPEGTLTLRAYHEGGHVTVEISDDGAGIDVDRVARTGVERGLISAAQAAQMEPREIIMLVFQPGFSTARQVTNVSGRGVGMDVVKTNIERIGGAVDVETTLGAGTTWRLTIPLTLAIIQALTIECAGERYVIPQVAVHELVYIDGQSTKIEYASGAPVYRLRGRLLPLVRLDQTLGLPAGNNDEGLYVVVLQADSRRFGVVVDRVLNTEEVVVKALTARFKDIGLYAGATILGDGKVALILDVASLARRSHLHGAGTDRLALADTVDTSATSSTVNRLLITGVGDRRVAIPLDTVTRLEEFAKDRIERVGRREVVQYREQILPLVRLADLLGAMPDDTGDTVPVVVYTEHERSVALAVDKIVDIVEDAITARRDTDDDGLAGSAVIQQRMTELLDVRRAILAADPNFYAELPDQQLVEA
ncbi:MAG TPA: chemotaxis protein CheA [Rugosimonospora sp.]|nr:chemotaxis protein CheA [Rugosimonospora sp.]